ncbi:hypothetical protein PK98_14565 [Croceibacterium mercuriale]|uniref:Uncharacterized protein n=1 Tax=Croceibacterium mercuriale TaxID=1572751 RepID=A0A0B2BRR5_9SPHN|nr:hypothetical protein PK98_14565 [Croceibacterium mercuriale]
MALAANNLGTLPSPTRLKIFGNELTSAARVPCRLWTTVKMAVLNLLIERAQSTDIIDLRREVLQLDVAHIDFFYIGILKPETFIA